jgi:hypothetical protein
MMIMMMMTHHNDSIDIMMATMVLSYKENKQNDESMRII